MKQSHGRHVHSPHSCIMKSQQLVPIANQNHLRQMPRKVERLQISLTARDPSSSRIRTFAMTLSLANIAAANDEL
jgi:hypothetical protein